MPDVQRLREDDLRALFGRLAGSRPLSEAIRLVLDRVASVGQAMLQGGILRDAALEIVLGRSIRPNDVDFVVFGMPSDDILSRCFAPDGARANTFGGIKLSVAGISIDIWRAELQLRCAASPEPLGNVTNLLRCVTLTPDAVLFDPASGKVEQSGFLDALNRREIRLGKDSRWVRPWAAYHLAHLAHVIEKTGFRPHDTVLERVRAVADGATVKEASEYLARKGRTKASAMVRELVATAASAAH